MEEKEIQNFSELGEAFASAKETAKQHAKEDIANLTELVPQIPRIAKEMAERGLSEYAAQVDQSFDEIETNKIEQGLGIGVAAGNRTNQDQKWGKEHSDRSQAVVGAVQSVKETSTNVRTGIASGALTVTSIVGKGLALFGKKDLAKQMQEKVSSKSMEMVSKKSRIGGFFERVAEHGFKITDSARKAKADAIEFGVATAGKVKDGVRSGIDTAVEFGGQVKQGVQTGIRTGIDTTKATALQVGKSAYQGVAKVAGLGELAIEGAVSGGKYVAGKVKQGKDYVVNKAEQGMDFVADKAEQGMDFVADKAEEGKDFLVAKGRDGMDYASIATNKIAQAPTKMSKGIKSFFASKAKAFLDYISPSIERDQQSIDTREQAIAASKENIDQRKVQQDSDGR